MATLPGLNKGVTKDPTPPATDTVVSPIIIPDGTTLITTKTTNETIDNVDQLIDYISGDNSPNFIPQLAIDSLVSDLAGKEPSLGFTPENIASKGAVSGYAGLDASQELLLANFPSGTSLQVLRRNAANTALEFASGEFFGPWTNTHDAAGFNLINFGILESSDANPASTGVIRLGNFEQITWRDNANTANVILSVNTSDQFFFTNEILNPTLITPVITDFVNSQHDHQSGAGGGQLLSTAALSDTANIARDSNTLAFFSSTTSLELLGVISDETGTGLLVFGTSPIIVTPTIASFLNAGHNHESAAGGGQLNSTLALSDTANIAYLNTANTYIAGTRQDFLGLLAGTAGLNVGGIAGNPTSQVNGDIWLNTSTNQIFGRINGVDVDLGAGGGSGITSINGETGAAQTIAGTTNRISIVTTTDTQTLDIDASYVGQASITTLGTITTGVWNGTAITGANINAASTDLTDSASLARSSNNLSFFAATTSLQLIGVISDETGSGLLVFGTSPTIVTPTIASFTNSQHNHQAAAGGGQLVATLALTATGTKDSTTFLRGDDTWAVPAGGGGPDTPWTVDHDIDRFDYDEGGVIFFSLFGPRVTPTAIGEPFIFYNDNLTPEAIVVNIPTGDEFQIHFNGVEAYSFSSTILDLTGSAIQNAGNIFLESNTGGVILRLENTASSPANGSIAGNLQFVGDRIGSSAIDYGQITVEMIDTSSGSADGEMRLMVANGNTENVEYITLNEGSSQTIHFKKDVQDFAMSGTTGTAEIIDLEGLRFTDDATQLTSILSYIQRSNSSLIIHSPTGEDIQLQISNSVELTIALNLVSTPIGTNLNIGGDIIVGDRFQGNKGPDVAGASTVTLGDGNYFDITGNTNIDFMTTTNWQIGSTVVLQFDANSGANDNTASPPINTAPFALAGDFTASAGDTLTVAFDGTFWRELSRSVN